MTEVVTRHMLVFGVVSTEHQHVWRARLRKLYARHAGTVLAIYVVSAGFEHDRRWNVREDSVGGRVVADVLFAPAAHTSTALDKSSPYRQAHCAHKTIGWWRAARRWPSVWYGKTDDDAVIDLPPLLTLLTMLPSGPVFGGIVRYSGLNASNLNGECFSPGALGVVNKRRFGSGARRCASFEGPYPYVEGPLEILSADVAGFLADRAAVDARMRCHFEDLYIGRLVAMHPRLSLVNLDTLLGHKDVWNPFNGRFVGADSLLAHWVRDGRAFELVTAGFEASRIRSPAASALHCAPWASSFVELSSFPCCQNWSVCEPQTPLLRRRGTGSASGVELGEGSSKSGVQHGRKVSSRRGSRVGRGAQL